MIAKWDTMAPNEVQLAGMPLYVNVRTGEKEVWVIHPKMMSIVYHGLARNPPKWAGAENASWRNTLTKATGLWGANEFYSNVRNGKVPYERFKNEIDGKWWGKFYNEKTDDWTLKPWVPEDNALEKIGKAIVKAVKWVFKSLKKLFDWICRKQGTVEGNLATQAGAAALGDGTGATAGIVASLCALAHTPSPGPSAPPVMQENPWMSPLLLAGGGLALFLLLRKKG